MKTKTSANAAKKTANPSKGAKKANLNKINLRKAAASANAERVTKYRYPADATTPEAKKAFRRQARATNRRLHKEIEALKASKEQGAKSKLQGIQAELGKFEKSTYTEIAA
jgi:hypothetical protein